MRLMQGCVGMPPACRDGIYKSQCGFNKDVGIVQVAVGIGPHVYRDGTSHCEGLQRNSRPSVGMDHMV